MIVEILIGKSHYKITCEESEKEKLIRLANRLNKRLESISSQIGATDEKTLLVMTSLMLEEESEHHDNISHQHHELNDQDMYDAVSENIENIADYIEKLTKKIQNY